MGKNSRNIKVGGGREGGARAREQFLFYFFLTVDCVLSRLEITSYLIIAYALHMHVHACVLFCGCKKYFPL